MREIKITVDNDLHELLGIIARKKCTSINELVHDIVKNEASKMSWRIIFSELEEAYEKEKERRN